MHSGKTQPNWIKEDNGHNFRKSKRTELENIIHHKEDKLANGPRETSQRKQKSRNISSETWIIQTECVPLKCRWDAIGLENTHFSFLQKIQNVAKKLNIIIVLCSGSWKLSFWKSLAVSVDFLSDWVNPFERSCQWVNLGSEEWILSLEVIESPILEGFRDHLGTRP